MAATPTPSDTEATTPGCRTGLQQQGVDEEADPGQPSGAGQSAAVDLALTRPLHTRGGWRQLVRDQGREHGPLTLAVLLSLLVHALLLGMVFGGDESGLPGLALPWQERRIEAPDLHVVLAPAPVGAAGPALMPLTLPPPRQAIEPSVEGDAVPTPTVLPATDPQPSTMVNVLPAEPMAPQAPDSTPAMNEGQAAVARASPVLVAPAPPAPVFAVAPSASSPQDRPQALQEAVDATQHGQPDEATREEAARADAARREAERQEAARQVAAQFEAQRREAARLEAARAEAVRQEAQRQETARQAATQLEAQQREAARLEAARAEAVRQEAQRQETARQAAAQLEAQQREATRQEAARAEAARQAAAAQEAAKLAAAQAEAARREEVLKAIGRQLDEEAARREAATKAAQQPNALPYSLSTARRVRLWGRSDPNAALVEYAEAWARRIQFNTPVDMVRELAQRPHSPPMVTVAIRSDGSVESVTFVVSSGVAQIDEAIRRIVDSLRPYPVFPPALAREVDVIEIRRTWNFDSSVRLQ